MSVLVNKSTSLKQKSLRLKHGSAVSEQHSEANHRFLYSIVDFVKVFLTKCSAGRVICLSLCFLTLNGCFHPPYNNFSEDQRDVRQVAFGTAFGAGAGAIIGFVAGSAGTGAVIGGVAGSIIALQNNTQNAIIKELQKQDMQFIQYGDTMTLLVPTDRYYIFNSARLNDICYPGLINIIKLLKFYPKSTIYVAGFTDNVGSKHHKKMLSQARAEAMLTFLWANNIQAQRLHAEGYADKHAIGNNDLIRGSAYNRRVEIQWVNAPVTAVAMAPYVGATK